MQASRVRSIRLRIRGPKRAESKLGRDPSRVGCESYWSPLPSLVKDRVIRVIRVLVKQHVMPARGTGLQFVEVDLEKRIHFDSVGTDVRESHPECAGVIECA